MVCIQVFSQTFFLHHTCTKLSILFYSSTNRFNPLNLLLPGHDYYKRFKQYPIYKGVPSESGLLTERLGDKVRRLCRFSLQLYEASKELCAQLLKLQQGRHFDKASGKLQSILIVCIDISDNYAGYSPTESERNVAKEQLEACVEQIRQTLGKVMYAAYLNPADNMSATSMDNICAILEESTTSLEFSRKFIEGLKTNVCHQ